tara:strand:- start:659 stop:1195 length:537 start_codon:yes stop_codon:yes gene_type:complete
MNDALQTSNLPDLASTSARVSVASIVSKGQTTMTSIFIVSSDTSSDIAFASIGTALQYIRDSHGDENPEGCTLMLQTPSGLVPESTTAVRARADLTLPCRFRAVDSDAAGRGAKIRSDLDGCLKGAALLGVDPESVAKIHELRADLEAETANVAAEADTVGYSLTVMRLHKRKGARRN